MQGKHQNEEAPRGWHCVPAQVPALSTIEVAALPGIAAPSQHFQATPGSACRLCLPTPSTRVVSNISHTIGLLSFSLRIFFLCGCFGSSPAGLSVCMSARLHGCPIQRHRCRMRRAFFGTPLKLAWKTAGTSVERLQKAWRTPPEHHKGRGGAGPRAESPFECHWEAALSPGPARPACLG